MPLWKDPKNGKYRYQFQHLGRRYSKTGFATQKAARSALEQHRAELEQEAQTPPSPPTLCVSDSGPLDPGNLDGEASTVGRTQPGGLRLDLPSGGLSPLSGPCGQCAGQMNRTRIMWRIICSPGPPTTISTRSAPNSCVLFSWALKRRLVSPINPVAAVDKLTVEKTRKVIPTPEEMAKILMAAGKDRPFLLVLFHTMARIDEVLRLKWEDVNFTEQKACGSGPASAGEEPGRFDWLSMNEDLEKVLWALWQKRTQDEWVFVKPLDRDPLQASFHVDAGTSASGPGCPTTATTHPSLRGELSVR